MYVSLQFKCRDVFYTFFRTELLLSAFSLGGGQEKNQKSHHFVLIGCSADSSHVSGSGSERQAHSVITAEARLISSQKDKWEEWG